MYIYIYIEREREREREREIQITQQHNKFKLNDTYRMKEII